MIETPQVVQTDAQLTAFIHIIVPRQEIQTVMGPGLAELTSVLVAQGIEPTGPWFTHHLRRPAETFDFEICFPVAARITPSGRVEAGQLPGAKVARTMYHGSYEGLGAAWGEIDQWIRANDYKPAKDLWESYVAGPKENPDPATWRTELNWPLVD